MVKNSKNMNNILYIIPGWEDSTSGETYKKLGKVAEEKGYTVIYKDVDWKKPLSEQVFTVEKDAVIFGFSLGAVLAWLIAQKHECRLLILASMTPHASFVDAEIKQALVDLTGSECTEDVINHLTPSHKAQKQILMYGDQEGEPADILVPNTEHEITDEYIEEILKLLP